METNNVNPDIDPAAQELRGTGHAPMQIPPPSAPGDYGPRISEDNFDQDAWDEWYREQIRLSIEDPRPSIPHEDVLDWMERKLQSIRSRHAQSCNA